MLARECDGNKSIVKDQETGMLYCSPEQFILKSQTLITEPKKRAELVTHGKEFVNQNYNVKKEQLMYQQIVHKIAKD